MAAEGQAPTAGEYIVHHLAHLQNKKPEGPFDLSVFNYDSVFVSTLLGIVTCWILWAAARKGTSAVPGRFQAAVELLVEMVEMDLTSAGQVEMVEQMHRPAEAVPEVRVVS